MIFEPGHVGARSMHPVVKNWMCNSLLGSNHTTLGVSKIVLPCHFLTAYNSDLSENFNSKALYVIDMRSRVLDFSWFWSPEKTVSNIFERWYILSAGRLVCCSSMLFIKIRKDTKRKHARQSMYRQKLKNNDSDCKP